MRKYLFLFLDLITYLRFKAKTFIVDIFLILNIKAMYAYI